jgi:hypothetical protein
MKRMIALALMGTLGSSLSASAELTGFDKEKTGQLPKGWLAGVTGLGAPVWAIVESDSAASKKNVLLQSGKGDYPWATKTDSSLEDGFVEAKFKPVSGEDDQAGGLIWRFKDGNNYYVARGNALENNVSLYYTENGKRKTIKYVDAPVKKGEWNLLRAEFSGKRIRILLNGKAYIELEDDHISGSGAVGVWTKADSVTEFDDFSFGKQ